MNINFSRFVICVISLFSSCAWGIDISKCGGGTQLELNVCSEEQYITADKELNRLYKVQMEQLDSKDKKSFRDIQKTWLKYRDDTCTYEAASMWGGSGWASTYNGCLADMTEDRNKILRRYLGCTYKRGFKFEVQRLT